MSERIVSLFSGIGGLDIGFHERGQTPLLFCENDHAAQAVLGSRFPDVPVSDDVSTLKKLPSCDQTIRSLKDFQGLVVIARALSRTSFD